MLCPFRPLHGYISFKNIIQRIYYLQLFKSKHAEYFDKVYHQGNKENGLYLHIFRKIICGEDIFRVTVLYAAAKVRGFKVVSGESRAGSKRVCLMTCKVSGRKPGRPDGHNIPARH